MGYKNLMCEAQRLRRRSRSLVNLWFSYHPPCPTELPYLPYLPYLPFLPYLPYLPLPPLTSPYLPGAPPHRPLGGHALLRAVGPARLRLVHREHVRDAQLLVQPHHVDGLRQGRLCALLQGHNRAAACCRPHVFRPVRRAGSTILYIYQAGQHDSSRMPRYLPPPCASSLPPRPHVPLSTPPRHVSSWSTCGGAGSTAASVTGSTRTVQLDQARLCAWLLHASVPGDAPHTLRPPHATRAAHAPHMLPPSGSGSQ